MSFSLGAVGRAVSQVIRPDPKPQDRPQSPDRPEQNAALRAYHTDSFESGTPRRASGNTSVNAATGPTGATGASFDPNNPADVDALAREYAPIRYLHPEEDYGPADPNQFIENARLREQRDILPDTTRDGFDHGEIDPSSLPEQEGDNLFLDLPDEESAREGTPDAPSFYEYDAGSRTLTYHQFYNYNDAPGPDNLNHEGDWERVTIQFDDQMKPTHVRYSAHEEATEREWKDVPLENGRPVVYTGLGSHANSPTTGSGPTGVPGVEDSFARGNRIDTGSQPLLNVTEQPWYNSDVHWGQAGFFDFTSGPTGPSEDKGPLLPEPEDDGFQFPLIIA